MARGLDSERLVLLLLRQLLVEAGAVRVESAGPRVVAGGDVSAPVRPDGFALPVQVRRVRAWWLREARDHVHKARTKRCSCTSCAPGWHLDQARQARQYARGVVTVYLATGKVPL